MLSNTCKYAIRSVIYIAVNERENQKIGIKRISKDLDLPAPFLSKILQALAKNKILKSTKGPNGGFILNKNSEDLSLLDIVEVIDGTDFFHTCIIGLKLCEDNPEEQNSCPFHDKLDPLRENLLMQFKTLTVGDFKNNLANIDKVLSF